MAPEDDLTSFVIPYFALADAQASARFSQFFQDAGRGIAGIDGGGVDGNDHLVCCQLQRRCDKIFFSDGGRQDKHAESCQDPWPGRPARCCGGRIVNIVIHRSLPR